jgi:hypothetical protein
MAMTLPEPGARSRQRVVAIVLGLALAGATLLANFALLAESPRGGAVGLERWIGAGQLGKLRAQQIDSAGRPPANIAAVARRALPVAPLAFEPFFGVAAAGFRTPGSFGSETDAKLLREALRRNPRSREARALLLRHALGAGRLDDAIEQLAVLNRLNPGEIAQLMTALGQSIVSDRQIVEVVDALKPYPDLYRPFLRGFVQARKPAAQAVTLVTRLPQAAYADPEVRVTAIGLLVEAQAYGQARAIWGGGTRTGELVHSPDFADRKALPPFNWAFTANETGASERGKAGGVDIVYYGRESGSLLSQLVTLAPGSYTATVEYRTVAGTPGAIGLEVRCGGSPVPLTMRPLDAKAGVGGEISLGFTVPPQGCGGQTLALIGRPLELRSSQEIAVRRIDVTRGVTR